MRVADRGLFTGLKRALFWQCLYILRSGSAVRFVVILVFIFGLENLQAKPLNKCLSFFGITQKSKPLESKILNLFKKGNIFSVEGKSAGRDRYFTFLYDQVAKKLKEDSEVVREDFDGHGLKVEFKIADALLFMRRTIKDVFDGGEHTLKDKKEYFEALRTFEDNLINYRMDSVFGLGKEVLKREVIEDQILKMSDAEGRGAFEQKPAVIRKEFEVKVSDWGWLLNEVWFRTLDGIEGSDVYFKDRPTWISFNKLPLDAGVAHVVVSKEFIALVENLSREDFKNFI